MKLTQATRLSASVLALVLLAGSSIAYASTPVQLNANFAGGVIDAGNQKYRVEGGTVVLASFLGNPLDPAYLEFEYSLRAEVTGSSVTGRASLELESNEEGSDLEIKGEVDINGAIGVAVGPSQIPFYLTGTGTLSVEQDETEQEIDVLMLFESPYWNPFGNPILITTVDSSLVIVTTYTRGTIDWSYVATGAFVFGQLDEQPFSGTFTQIAKAHEDLVAGTEKDSGTITLDGLPGVGPLSGDYRGESVIPAGGTPGGLGCEAFPAELQTLVCTSTALNSTGELKLKGDGLKLSGEYVTVWSEPAITFTGTLTASGTQE